MMLPTLPLIRLRFTYRLRDRLPHAAVQGSLWRGALGYALKWVTCAYPNPFSHPCPACPLYNHCSYPSLFEPVVPSGQSAASSEDAARPFALEPPLHAVNPLPAGEFITLGLVLMGPALRDIPTFFRAGALLGERGIGQSEARATLIEATAANLDETSPIWPDNNSRPLPLIHSEQLACRAASLPPDLLLRFVTPTRLKRDRAIVTKPDAETIVRALLRRLISLAALYGEPWYPESHRLLDMAASLHMEGEVEWRAASHTSSRQKRRLPLDGFEGTLTLRGVPEELRALLLLGSYVHIGKQATCGHGWYVVEEA